MDEFVLGVRTIALSEVSEKDSENRVRTCAKLSVQSVKTGSGVIIRWDNSGVFTCV